MTAPLQEHLFESLCDAGRLGSLIKAAELALDQIGDDPKNPKFRQISRQDERILSALLYSART